MISTVAHTGRPIRKPVIHVFTLVEIMAVMAIIAILMGIGVGVYSTAMSSAKRAKTQSLLKKVEISLEAFKVKYGYYPQVMDQRLFFLDLAPRTTTPALTPTDEQLYFWKTIDLESIKSANTNKYSNETGTIMARYYLIDAWGSPIYYCCPGKKNINSYDLVSTGSDQMIGDKYALSWTGRTLYEMTTNSNTTTTATLKANIQADLSADDPDKSKLAKFGEGDDITNSN